MILAITAVGLLAMDTACTDEAAGTPTTSTGTSQARTTVAPTTSRLLPPRPRDLDLTGLDPCKVLTRAQMHELAYDLGYQFAPEPIGNDVINHGPTCGYASDSPVDQPSRHIGTNINISTSEGAEAWLTDPMRKTSAELARKTTIEGFPALILPSPMKKFQDGCDAVVDTHDGQYLQTVTEPQPGYGGKGPEPSCDEAVRVAGMAIQTIESRR